MQSVSPISDLKMLDPKFLANPTHAARHSSKKISLITYSACEHFWSYANKMVLITRSFLNAAAKNLYVVSQAGSQFVNQVKKITTHMKLLSIVGVAFSIGNLKTTAQKIVKDALCNDKEGIVLSTISFTIIASDILDSITTFVNATLTLMCKETIALFSKMALPLGFIMSGLGVVSRTIQVAKSLHLYRKSLDKTFLIQLQKKMRIDALGIAANLLVLSALTLFSIGTSSALPFLLLALAFSLRLSLIVYQDYF